MSDTANSPIPYRVAYSEFVRTELRNLVAKARERNLGAPFLAALKELDYRLHTYPQFGDPLRDLSLGSARLCIGTVPPLVVHYILHEEERLVIIVVPMMLLPRSGL